MSGILKKLFSTLLQNPLEKEQMAIDTSHTGKTFNISEQKSAVIIIFGIATVLYSLIFTAYIFKFPLMDIYTSLHFFIARQNIIEKTHFLF